MAARPTSTGMDVEMEEDALPEFRSVSVSLKAERPLSLAEGRLKGSEASGKIWMSEVKQHKGSQEIKKEDYFATVVQPLPSIEPQPLIQPETPKFDELSQRGVWSPKEPRQVPAFYPLERSSRLSFDDLITVVSRILEALRLLSIYAKFCNETASADLFTSDNVEMYLCLWKKEPNNILIEIQRRKGDSIAFHRYSRCILDTAAGELDIKKHVEENGEDLDMVYRNGVQRLVSLEEKRDMKTERENAIVAVEIAHGLLKKDRMDARQLGLESLCLLTDPRKTGTYTALIASRVVLLGTAQDDLNPEEDELMMDETPFLEIQQIVLSLIQFRRIGEEGGDDDDFEVNDIEQEHITVLHNLALAVLANALSVISDDDNLVAEAPEEVESINRRRLDTSESISDRFLEESVNSCPDGSEKKEIMKTLISELGKAQLKPHNACLSAKCLRSLCKASNKARDKAKELGAKTVVQTALEVGTRTHLKLERECSKVLSELTQTNTE
eukprot:jgi/Psemu1/282912/fgenesh1_pg.16_\